MSLNVDPAPTFDSNSPHHPLDPLSKDEIVRAVSAVRAAITQEDTMKEDRRIWFKAVQLQETAKKTVLPVLNEWNDALAHGKFPKALPRVAEVLVGVKTKKETKWFEYYVAIPPKGNGRVLKSIQNPPGFHMPIDATENVEAEGKLLENPEFKAAIAQLQLPKEAKVVADPWIYGADTTEIQPRYLTYMIYLSFSDNPDANHYAAPLPIVPTVLADTYELVRIDYPPIRGTGTETIKDLKGRFPWEHYVKNDYDEQMLVEQGQAMRKDLRPLRVVQPEGASVGIPPSDGCS